MCISSAWLLGPIVADREDPKALYVTVAQIQPKGASPLQTVKQTA